MAPHNLYTFFNTGLGFQCIWVWGPSPRLWAGKHMKIAMYAVIPQKSESPWGLRPSFKQQTSRSLEVPEFPPIGRPSRSQASSRPCYKVNSAQKQAAGLNTMWWKTAAAGSWLLPSPLAFSNPSLVWSFFLKKHAFSHSMCWSLCHKVDNLICPFALESLLFPKVISCQTKDVSRSLLEMLKIMLV